MKLQANKINSLQMLRAVAVGLVMFIHTSNFIGIPGNPYHSFVDSFYDLLHWGAIGVDLFFVISGFIMILIAPAYTGRGRWKDFLLKRAIRIIPLYYLVSLYVYISEAYHHNSPLPLSVIKTILFFPFFDKEVFAIPVLVMGWSLSYEMYFYILIAIFLVVNGNVTKHVLTAIIVLSAIGVVFNPGHVVLKFLTSPMLLEFGLGIAIGILYKQQGLKFFNGKAFSIALLATGALLMVLSVFTGSQDINMQQVIENDNHRALYRVIIWGLPCAMATLGLLLLERTTNFTTPVVLILLGDASYSAYLIHIKVYQWYSKAFVLTGLNGTLFIVSAIAVCFAVSVVFYKYVERPLSVIVNKFILSKPVSVKSNLST